MKTLEKTPKAAPASKGASTSEFTQEPDGTVTIEGELLEFVEFIAAADGITEREVLETLIKARYEEATAPKTVPVELDEEPLAKLRAMFEAMGSNITAEEFLNEYLYSVTETPSEDGYLQDTVFGIEGWQTHPDKASIDAKLDAIANAGGAA